MSEYSHQGFFHSPRFRSSAIHLNWTALLYIFPFLLSACSNSVNLAVFSRIPKAKITVQLDSSNSNLDGTLDGQRIRFSNTAFGASRTLSFQIQNKGDQIAKGLSIGVSGTIDGTTFEVVENLCPQQLDYIEGKNTCKINVKFNAPVPQRIADFGDLGIAQTGQINFTYENGVIEKDAGPRIQIDNYALQGSSILAPYFGFASDQILVLPSPGASPRYVTEDRVNFNENLASPVSSPWLRLTNPNYETQSIPIHVTFNGGLLPRQDCLDFVEELNRQGGIGLSLQIGITDCKKSSQFQPLSTFLSSDSGSPDNCEDLDDLIQPETRSAQQTFRVGDNEFGSDSLLASCSDDRRLFGGQSTISLNFQPDFSSSASARYLGMRAYTAMISPTGYRDSRLIVKILSQSSKLDPPFWAFDGSEVSILDADSSSPTLRPTLSWPSRLSKINGSLPLSEAAYFYQIDLKKIDHSPTPSESFCPQNSISTTDASAYSLIFDPQNGTVTSGLSLPTIPSVVMPGYQVPTSSFLLSNQLSSAKNTSNQVMSWTPHAWYQSCVRAIDSFGNYSSGLISLLQVSDIAPPNFSPGFQANQDGESNRIETSWNHDTDDFQSSLTYGKLDHYRISYWQKQGSNCSLSDAATRYSTSVYPSVNPSGCETSGISPKCNLNLTVNEDSLYPGPLCILTQACTLGGLCSNGNDGTSLQSLSLNPPSAQVALNPSPSPVSAFDSTGLISWSWDLNFSVTAYPTPNATSSPAPIQITGTISPQLSPDQDLAFTLNLAGGNSCSANTDFPNCKVYSSPVPVSYTTEFSGSKTLNYFIGATSLVTLTLNNSNGSRPFSLSSANYDSSADSVSPGFSSMTANSLHHYVVQGWKQLGGSCTTLPASGTSPTALHTWIPTGAAAGSVPSSIGIASNLGIPACDGTTNYRNADYCLRLLACDSGVPGICAASSPKPFYRGSMAAGGATLNDTTGIAHPGAGEWGDLAGLGLTLDGDFTPASPTPVTLGVRTQLTQTWNPSFTLRIPNAVAINSVSVERKVYQKNSDGIFSQLNEFTNIQTTQNPTPGSQDCDGMKPYVFGLRANNLGESSGDGWVPSNFNYTDSIVCYQVSATLNAGTNPAQRNYCHAFPNSQNIPTVSWSPAPSPLSAFNPGAKVQWAWMTSARITSPAQTLLNTDLILTRSVSDSASLIGPSSSPIPISSLSTCSGYTPPAAGPWCYQLVLPQNSLSFPEESARASANSKLDTTTSAPTETFLSDLNYQSFAGTQSIQYSLSLPGASNASSSPAISLTNGASFGLTTASYQYSPEQITVAASPLNANSLDYYRVEVWQQPSGACSTNPSPALVRSAISSPLPTSVAWNSLSPAFGTCGDEIGRYCVRLQACTTGDAICAPSNALPIERTLSSAQTLTVSAATGASEATAPALIGEITPTPSSSPDSGISTLHYTWNPRFLISSPANLGSISVSRAHVESPTSYPTDAEISASTFNAFATLGPASVSRETPTGCGVSASVPVNRYLIYLTGTSANAPQSSKDLSIDATDFNYHRVCYKISVDPVASFSPSVTTKIYCSSFRNEPPVILNQPNPVPSSSFDSSGTIFWAWNVDTQIRSFSSSLTSGSGTAPGTFSLVENSNPMQVTLPSPSPSASPWTYWIRAIHSPSSVSGSTFNYSLNVNGRALSLMPSSVPVPSSSPFSLTGVTFQGNNDTLTLTGNPMQATSLRSYFVKMWEKTGSTCGTWTSPTALAGTSPSAVPFPASSSSPLPSSIPVSRFFSACSADRKEYCVALQACNTVSPASGGAAQICSTASNVYSFTRNLPAALSIDVPANELAWNSFFGDGINTPLSPSPSSAARTWTWSVPLNITSPSGSLTSISWKRIVREQASDSSDYDSNTPPTPFPSASWGPINSQSIIPLPPPSSGCVGNSRSYSTAIDNETSTSQGWGDTDSTQFQQVCYQITAATITESTTRYFCHSFQKGPSFAPQVTRSNDNSKITVHINNTSLSPNKAYPMDTSGLTRYKVRLWNTNSASDLCSAEPPPADQVVQWNGPPPTNSMDLNFSAMCSSIDPDRPVCAVVDACEQKKTGSGEHCSRRNDGRSPLAVPPAAINAISNPIVTLTNPIKNSVRFTPAPSSILGDAHSSWSWTVQVGRVTSEIPVSKIEIMRSVAKINRDTGVSGTPSTAIPISSPALPLPSLSGTAGSCPTRSWTYPLSYSLSQTSSDEAGSDIRIPSDDTSDLKACYSVRTTFNVSGTEQTKLSDGAANCVHLYTALPAGVSDLKINRYTPSISGGRYQTELLSFGLSGDCDPSVRNRSAAVLTSNRDTAADRYAQVIDAGQCNFVYDNSFNAYEARRVDLYSRPIPISSPNWSGKVVLQDRDTAQNFTLSFTTTDRWGNRSINSTYFRNNFKCENGFIGVPARLADSSTRDFCITQYPMTFPSGRPYNQPIYNSLSCSGSQFNYNLTYGYAGSYTAALRPNSPHASIEVGDTPDLPLIVNRGCPRLGNRLSDCSSTPLAGASAFQFPQWFGSTFDGPASDYGGVSENTCSEMGNNARSSHAAAASRVCQHYFLSNTGDRRYDQVGQVDIPTVDQWRALQESLTQTTTPSSRGYSGQLINNLSEIKFYTASSGGVSIVPSGTFRGNRIGDVNELLNDNQIVDSPSPCISGSGANCPNYSHFTFRCVKDHE